MKASNKQFKTSIGKLQKLINQLACCGVTNDPTKSPSFSPTENEEYSNFTFSYEVELQGVDEKDQNFLVNKRLEVFLKDILNAQNDDKETIFHSFGFDSKEKYSIWRGRGKGECKGKRCRLPPQTSIPKCCVAMKTHIRHENGMQILSSSLFDDLVKSSVEIPNFSYMIESKKLDSKITYNLEFEPTIISPWKSLDSISLTPITIIEQHPSNTCSVDEDFCGDQRTHITSVFRHLEVDFDEDIHECSWPGVVCDDLHLITELYIGKNICWDISSTHD